MVNSIKKSGKLFIIKVKLTITSVIYLIFELNLKIIIPSSDKKKSGGLNRIIKKSEMPNSLIIPAQSKAQQVKAS